MYIILAKDDDSLIATNRENIMQRSKLVNNLVFITNKVYRELNIEKYDSVLLEYVMPISRNYKTEFLTQTDDLYDGYLTYKLPVDTELTTEHGDIEVHLTFHYLEMDADGNTIQRVRKTKSTKITVTPVKAWSDIIPDSALSALDQRIIKMDAQLRAMESTKADNLIYNEADNFIQLEADGQPIGRKVVHKDCTKDGVTVIEFGETSGSVTSPEYDVIEF